MDKEDKTRGVLKRTKAKYRLNPTPGRFLAIQRFERFLRQRALLRIVAQNPDIKMTVREIMWYLS